MVFFKYLKKREIDFILLLPSEYKYLTKKKNGDILLFKNIPYLNSDQNWCSTIYSNNDPITIDRNLMFSFSKLKQNDILNLNEIRKQLQQNKTKNI